MFLLKIIFSFIYFFMIYATTKASLSLNLFDHLPTLIKDPWAVMTLYDAYFAFFFFYLWVYYKEPKWYNRLLWFVLIAMFGTITMSLYMLIQLFTLDKFLSIEDLLVGKNE
jgi:hypothetical protein